MVNLQKSGKDTEKLDRFFLEAKWLRNFVIADVENRIIGKGKLIKTLPVDGGEVTPVERGLSLVEAGSSSLK